VAVEDRSFVVFPQTKFHHPPVRSEHVERSPLLDGIARSGARVVVVSAPAGFGKSTLLAQWAARSGRGTTSSRVAWVSVEQDDHGRRLWLAVLAALRPLVGTALDAVLDGAEAGDADLRAGVLIGLVDALATTPEPIALVLDDLHLAVADPATRDSVDWFLAHLPPMHTVLLATRRDPGLDALRRLRSHGQVQDIRADDLRFGADETRAFLRGTLGLKVDEDVVDALERRTEGWPAALYLAALRLRVGDTTSDVVERLRASDENLIGDLVDELLRSSPAHERRFILETSVLQRFNLDLCVRLLGDADGTAVAFADLTRTSLLLTPLDRTRTWFRFHHLLRDVLHNRLVADDPHRARELHVRAGGWFESEGGEGELHEAMHHYLAAQDWDLAAELLACHSIRFVQAGVLGGRARDWLARFPPETVAGDARLCHVSALLAALAGDRDARDAWLANGRAAGWTGPMPDGTASFELASLCLEAMLCFDDLGGAVAAARRALTSLPPAAPVRAAVEALTAWHLHLLGEDDEARHFAQRALGGQVHLPSAGLPLVSYLPRAVLALVALRHGATADARALVTAAVTARDAGALRASPHALPVAYAQARLMTRCGHPDDAIATCRTALELTNGWRDPSLMVPALLLELARAHGAAGNRAAAGRVQRQAAEILAPATDPGALPAALEVVADDPASAFPVRADGPASGELSAREVEVLRALSGGGSLRQVADDLFVSRNTIKTHTRALYSKLGVASRSAAVDRAHALGLLRADDRRHRRGSEDHR